MLVTSEYNDEDSTYTFTFNDEREVYSLRIEIGKVLKIQRSISVADLRRMLGEEHTGKETVYGWHNIDEFVIAEDPSTCSFTLRTSPPCNLLDDEHATMAAKEPDDNQYKSDDKFVSHPPHYKAANGMETIDVIDAFTSDLLGVEATDTGNIIKYACRWKHKNGVQDLEKIMWYTQHLINHVNKNGGKTL